MTEEYILKLIGGKENETARLILDSADDEECRITLHFQDQTLTASSTDYFDAFCLIRRQLGLQNLIPWCYGASLNVFPSGMARDMGQGLKAYRTTLGQQAKKDDLVFIFDHGADIIPAYVEVQEVHYRKWLNSLGIA